MALLNMSISSREASWGLCQRFLVPPTVRGEAESKAMEYQVSTRYTRSTGGN